MVRHKLSPAGRSIAILRKSDVFDGFNNLTASLVQENDIAVLAHDFNNQSHSHAIANFVLIGDADFQNPIILHLLGLLQ